MNETIKLVHFDSITSSGKWDKEFSLDIAQRARAFHKTLPDYKSTPLVKLDAFAKLLGVSSIHVKDESFRFGLNAFKGLGGSYCIANYLAEKLGLNPDDLNFTRLTEPDIKARLGNIKFVTATDGNHGRGIAWITNKLGLKSVVFMPKGSSQERLANIQKLGSEASITEFNYDDTVRHAKKVAEENSWPLVQDTSWEGYERIPLRIMQGYLTMALEAVEGIDATPTHVFLQAGVGAMSGAVAGFISDYYKNNKPVITIVEPNKADCIFRTAEANDGKLHNVTGSLNTIMAGLACGEPCTIGWEELKSHCENFISMPDYVAAKGMRILGNPFGSDAKVISGESGASTLGFVAELMQNESLDYIRKALMINEDSNILCFSTEGDTDKENYRRIVWDGLYPSF